MRPNEIVGNRMRQAREEVGLTQERLGQALGKYLGTPWKKQSVSAAEKGRRDFTPEELLTLSIVLRKPVSWFFMAAGPAREEVVFQGTRMTQAELFAAIGFGGIERLRRASSATEGESGLEFDRDLLGRRHELAAALADALLQATEFKFQIDSLAEQIESVKDLGRAWFPESTRTRLPPEPRRARRTSSDKADQARAAAMNRKRLEKTQRTKRSKKEEQT
jgi:DNA-binding XRE family transcriptional regulator